MSANKTLGSLDFTGIGEILKVYKLEKRIDNVLLLGHNCRITTYSGENMYQIVICDDEKKILEDIHGKVKTALDKQEIQAEYFCLEDSRDLMEHLKEQKIDVLFLDIDMPYFSGMDIAAYINEKGLKTILIFVTSHDTLVYQTFAYRPFGFIRKTHLDEELEELAERIKKELFDRKEELTILKGPELTRIRIKDLVYMESEGNYLNFHMKDDVIKVRETLGNMENELMAKGFIRCHKGYLVNGDYIEKLKSAEMELKIEDEIEVIPIGRSYEKEVRKRVFELIQS